MLAMMDAKMSPYDSGSSSRLSRRHTQPHTDEAKSQLGNNSEGGLGLMERASYDESDSEHESDGTESDADDERANDTGAIMKQRHTILEEIEGKEKVLTDVEVSTMYMERLRQCLRKGSDEYETMLHSIVAYVCQMPKAKEKLLPLVELSLNLDNSLLEASSNTMEETALHMAIRLSNGNSSIESLARFICTTVHKRHRAILWKAISCQNENGENCLHLAIRSKLRLAQYLIKRADKSAFMATRKQPRVGKSNKPSLSDLGNTPLHDAVDFSRCTKGFQLCTSKGCERCKETSQLSPENSKQCDDGSLPAGKQHLVILENLVTKWPKALCKTNDSKLSPYQYHLQSRDQALKDEEGGDQVLSKFTVSESKSHGNHIIKQSAPDQASSDAKNLEGCYPLSPKEVGFKIDNTKSSRDIGVRTNNPKGQSKKTVSEKGNLMEKKSREREFSKQGDEDMQKEPSNLSRLRSKASNEVATWVGDYLKERSLESDSFKDAVLSLFGSNYGAFPLISWHILLPYSIYTL